MDPDDYYVYPGYNLGGKIDGQVCRLHQQKDRERIVQQVFETLKKVDKFPASFKIALNHQRANKFGQRPKNVGYQPNVCPDCQERIDVKQYDFCKKITLDCGIICQGQDQSNRPHDQMPINPGVSLFFYCIRMAIAFLILKFLLCDIYNIITNFKGGDCVYPTGEMSSCPNELYTRASTANKITIKSQIMTFQLLNLIMVVIALIFFCFASLTLYSFEGRARRQLQTQEDFTLFIKNIPLVLGSRFQQKTKVSLQKIVSQTLKSVIQQKKQLIKDGHDRKNCVRGVDLCWDITQFMMLVSFKEKTKNEVELMWQDRQQIRWSQQQKETFLKEDVHFYQSLKDFSEAYVRLGEQYTSNQKTGSPFTLSRFTGKAFVRFQYPYLAKIVYKSQLFLPSIKIEGHELQVEYAAHPRDVYWENIHITDNERKTKQRYSFLITFGALLFAFQAILGINLLQSKLPQDTDSSQQLKNKTLNYVLSFAISLNVEAINYGLSWAAIKLTNYEQHETKSKHQISHLFKLLFAQFINTAMIYYIVNFIIPTKIWDRNGLIMQVSSLITTSAIINVITNILNVSYRLHRFSLWWKYGINPFSHISNWVQKNKSKKVYIFQDRLNAEFELPEFDIAERYNYYIMNVQVVCFFSYIVPLGIPVLILVFFIQYFVEKWNLFKRSSVKSSYNLILARTAFKLLESSVFWFALGNLLFSIYFNNFKVSGINIAALVVALINLIGIWKIPNFLQLVFRDDIYKNSYRYDQSKLRSGFPHTYKNQNPALRYISNFFSTRLDKA